MKKNPVGFFILLALLIILPLMFIRNFFASRSFSENYWSPSITETPKLSITSIPSSEPKNGYISPAKTTRIVRPNNIKMNIPSNWHYLDCGVNCFFISPRMEEDKREIIDGFDINLGEVSVYGVEDNINSLEEAIPRSEKTIIEHSNGRKETVMSPVITNIKYLTVGGEKAIQWDEEVKGGEHEGKFRKVFVLSSGLQLVLYDLKYEKEFDSMLKSIRFVD